SKTKDQSSIMFIMYIINTINMSMAEKRLKVPKSEERDTRIELVRGEGVVDRNDDGQNSSKEGNTTMVFVFSKSFAGMLFVEE
ncbi:unnamed protein product, partial [Ilex paraguariensis]